MPDLELGFPDWLKKPVKSIGGLFTLFDVSASGGAGTLFLYLTPSAKLRWFIGVIGGIGCLLGYFVIAYLFSGNNSTVRGRVASFCLVGCILCAAVTLGLIDLLGAHVARAYTWAQGIREVLTVWNLIGNLVVGLFAGFTGFLMIATISILSPSMGAQVPPAVPAANPPVVNPPAVVPPVVPAAEPATADGPANNGGVPNPPASNPLAGKKHMSRKERKEEKARGRRRKEWENKNRQ